MHKSWPLERMLRQAGEFWAVVDYDGPELIPKSPCWLTPQERDNRSRKGHTRRSQMWGGQYMYRIAWMLANKREIPEYIHGAPKTEQMEIHHWCRNQWCVRPEHLILSTARFNQEMDDILRKAGREAWVRPEYRPEPKPKPAGVRVLAGGNLRIA